MSLKIEIGEPTVEERIWDNEPKFPMLRTTKYGVKYCSLCKYKRFENEEMHEKYIASTETKDYYCHSHSWCTDKFTKHELVRHYKEYGIPIGHWGTFIDRALKETVKTRRQHRTRNEEPCEICLEFFENKLDLEIHYQTHPDKYTCEVCNVGFKKILDYIRHRKGHGEDGLYACPLCEYFTKTYDLVRKHIVSRHEEFRKYKCKICQKRLASFAKYTEHVEYTHKDIKPVECDVCGKKLKTPRELHKHKYQIHEWPNKEDREKECSKCNFQFTSYRSMTTHNSFMHRLQPSFVCDICEMNFTSKAGMVKHLKRHQGEKQFKCSYCDLKFAAKDFRRCHERKYHEDCS